MKRLLCSLTLLVLCLGLAMAKGGAEIKFDKTSHDFGKFTEDNAVVSYTFTFTNVGDAPLIINQATASCGCTIPKYTKKPVLSEAFIKNILTAYYNIPNPLICKSIHGKPYIEGRKIHFNLTHSRGITALAVGKKRVGLDCERLDGRARPAVLRAFSEREKREIFGLADFYAHWTARESYIKHYGLTLAAYWRKVEYCGGKIYLGGELQPDKITQFTLGDHVFSVCGDYGKIVPRPCDPSKLRRS